MAPPSKQYAYTQLGDMFLYIHDDKDNPVPYPISSFVSTWAINEIPTAQCMLAVGRNVFSEGASVFAPVHDEAGKLIQMRKAYVMFSPSGDARPDGTSWPTGDDNSSQKIFDGYYMGMAYKKLDGKMQVVVRLVHWLVQLTWSSCLTSSSHPSNSAQLTTLAMWTTLATSSGDAVAGEPSILGSTGMNIVPDFEPETDLWGGLKKLLCRLAHFGGNWTFLDSCKAGDVSENNAALDALSKIEGGEEDDGDCGMDYEKAVELPVDTDELTAISDAIKTSLANTTTEGYATNNFWDKIVGEYCPQFNMALVPLVDRALVVAYTPALRGFYRRIDVTEETDIDFDSSLEKPLRGVASVIRTGSQLGSWSYPSDLKLPNMGGCFLVKSTATADGVLLIVGAPPWLAAIPQEMFATGEVPLIRTETTPDAEVGEPDEDPDEIFTTSNRLFVRYAQSVYVTHMLRGRSGQLGGPLRFDIAPGSNVEIAGSPEKFAQDNGQSIGQGSSQVDALGGTYYANVNRVTIFINAESKQAGTNFSLTHCRTEKENTLDRTSVKEHPIFGDAIWGDGSHGCALIDAYDFWQDQEE